MLQFSGPQYTSTTPIPYILIMVPYLFPKASTVLEELQVYSSTSTVLKGTITWVQIKVERSF